MLTMFLDIGTRAVYSLEIRGKEQGGGTPDNRTFNPGILNRINDGVNV